MEGCVPRTAGVAASLPFTAADALRLGDDVLGLLTSARRGTREKPADAPAPLLESLLDPLAAEVLVVISTRAASASAGRPLVARHAVSHR